jgi:hypothetical protein
MLSHIPKPYIYNYHIYIYPDYIKNICSMPKVICLFNRRLWCRIAMSHWLWVKSMSNSNFFISDIGWYRLLRQSHHPPKQLIEKMAPMWNSLEIPYETMVSWGCLIGVCDPHAAVPSCPAPLLTSCEGTEWSGVAAPCTQKETQKFEQHWSLTLTVVSYVVYLIFLGEHLVNTSKFWWLIVSFPTMKLPFSNTKIICGNPPVEVLQSQNTSKYKELFVSPTYSSLTYKTYNILVLLLYPNQLPTVAMGSPLLRIRSNKMKLFFFVGDRLIL